MASANDSFQRASFADIAFPIKEMRIRGRLRFHEHVYLKTPGAVVEKLGRGLYGVEMTPSFDANIRGVGVKYVDSINRLRALYERGVTAPLVIPGIGSMPAFIPEWDQGLISSLRSGMSVPLHFMEDATEQSLAIAASEAKAVSLQTTSSALVSLAKSLENSPVANDLTVIENNARIANIFGQIQDAVNSVIAIRDLAVLGQALVAAKVLALAEFLREVDRTLIELQDPANYLIVEAIHELIDAAQDLALDVTGKDRQPRIYRLPATMSISQVSNAIYGNTGKAYELMQNNDIEDPLTIVAGEQLIYFPVAA
jgi:hypothetical protein